MARLYLKSWGFDDGPQPRHYVVASYAEDGYFEVQI